MKQSSRYLGKMAYLVVTAMVLSACGGGGGGGTTTTPTGTTPTPHTESNTIAIVSCGTDSAIASYTPAQSGDVIEKDQENTDIQIYHSQENEKFVCVQNGKAHIVRK